MVVVCLKLGSFCVFCVFLNLCIWWANEMECSEWVEVIMNEWMNVNKIVYNFNFFGGVPWRPKWGFSIVTYSLQIPHVFKTNLNEFSQLQKLTQNLIL